MTARPDETAIKKERWAAFDYVEGVFGHEETWMLDDAKETENHRVTDWPFIQWALFTKG